MLNSVIRTVSIECWTFLFIFWRFWFKSDLLHRPHILRFIVIIFSSCSHFLYSASSFVTPNSIFCLWERETRKTLVPGEWNMTTEHWLDKTVKETPSTYKKSCPGATQIQTTNRMDWVWNRASYIKYRRLPA